MNKIKSIWTSITGSISSLIPLLFACCKSGACIGVCASPITSLFGISAATISNSPIVNSLEPLLIAISAVSFTFSYFSIYVLPKYQNNSNSCNTDCDCAPADSSKFNSPKLIFWVGLLASIFFFTYFEFQKHENQKALMEEYKELKEYKKMNADSSTMVEEKPCCAEGTTCEK